MKLKLTLLAHEDQLTRVQCDGQVTLGNLEGLPDPLEAILSGSGFSRAVLLDLERVIYVDSHGIGWFLRCHKHCVQAGGILVLYSVPPLVMQTFTLLRMNLVFHLATDEADARRLAAEARKDGKP